LTVYTVVTVYTYITVITFYRGWVVTFGENRFDTNILEIVIMELPKDDLQPQEQLAVSLYLKSMNKTQAASDAGYASPSVFNKPSVKVVIAEELSIRAERLRVGGDWVLMELKRVYDRCMQIEKLVDRNGNPTAEVAFDAANALKALALIGKHVDVRAFEAKREATTGDDEVVTRLERGRQRAALCSKEAVNEKSEAYDFF
jgi:hypothetical protein